MRKDVQKVLTRVLNNRVSQRSTDFYVFINNTRQAIVMSLDENTASVSRCLADARYSLVGFYNLDVDLGDLQGDIEFSLEDAA